MPWLQMEPMHQRAMLVAEDRLGRRSRAELFRLFEVSPRIGYKWLKRAEADAEDALTDRSRRPKSHPMTTDQKVVDRLVSLRRERPTWGARKLLGWLARHEEFWLLPAASTVTEILKREGLVVPRRRLPRGTSCRSPVADATAPNIVWSMDFKGDFLVGDGTRCFPLTVIDDYSRMNLCCHALPSTAEEPVERALERTFREWGLPDRMRSDNGTPFGTKCTGPLSRLSIWLIKLGIRPEYSRPASPQDNPRLERFHFTLKQETAFPPAASMLGQQRRFNRFKHVYNVERPHEAHGQLPPQLFHAASPRQFPTKIEAPTYPGHYEVVRIFAPGHLAWQGNRYYLSQPLGGELVGIVEVDNDVWDVYFGPLLVGRIDGRSQPPRLLPMFPV
jgi:putative transposase